jgi:hypothetical protein
MSQKKPLVVVSGATGTLMFIYTNPSIYKSCEINASIIIKPGAQGGSVVNSLLAAGRYKIRGLTRNPNSDKAKALAAKGVEMVKCDLSIKEDVKKGLKDADIAWIVTDFWNPVSNIFSWPKLCNKL